MPFVDPMEGQDAEGPGANRALDDAYELGPEVARQVDVNKPRRLKPEKVARLDWHNDLSKLLIDITQEVNAAADERSRSTIIRRLRRGLKKSE